MKRPHRARRGDTDSYTVGVDLPVKHIGMLRQAFLRVRIDRYTGVIVALRFGLLGVRGAKAVGRMVSPTEREE